MLRIALIFLKIIIFIVNFRNDIQNINSIKTIIAMLFHFSIWAGSFYVSFLFVGIWQTQSYTWFIGSLVGFLIETFLFEFLIEFIVAIFYSSRARSITYV